MNRELNKKVTDMGKNHRRKRIWRNVVVCLACVVVFCTVYALVLPAVTMEKNTAVICTEEKLSGHKHESSCYENGELTCGYADFVIHTHEESCYDENDVLICPLKEVKEHKHTDECYAEESELICENTDADHVHTKDCYKVTKKLVCKHEEVIFHVHSKSCFDAAGNITCGYTQVLRHQHEESCFVKKEETTNPPLALAAPRGAERNAATWIDVKNQINNAAPGDVVKLTSNITATESFAFNKDDVFIDLNGHTLQAPANNPLFNVNGGTLTIMDSSNANEAVSKVTDRNMYGNTATFENNTLTYYVTKTEIADQSVGSTAETLERHVVTLGDGSGGAIVGNGATRAIVQSGGTVNINSGYICGFNQGGKDENLFGGALHVTGGVMNLNGGVLAANSAPNGGAIYLSGNNNATLNINDGIISGNVANRKTDGWDDHSESGAYRCSGGGVYANGNTKIAMNGGYITNNEVTDIGYFDGGGGVCLSGTSEMVMSNGYVTGNSAGGGGGIRTDFGRNTNFTMSGGFVTANIARFAEGGGITIDRQGTSTITGGYVTNNRTETSEHWGGGGIFCADGSTLNMKCALVTENEAHSLGGGIAGCSTGRIYLFVNEGCAVFDNKDSDNPNFAAGGVKNGEDEKAYLYGDNPIRDNPHSDYFCALKSTVTGEMLGGGDANWKGSADGTAVQVNGDNAQTAEHAMGLKSFPTDEAKQDAKDVAKVYVNGNYSGTHGGGILANGNLIVGIPKDLIIPTQLRLEGVKSFIQGDENVDIKNGQFTFTVTDENGNVVTTGTSDENGKITFDNNLFFDETGTYTYYIRENVPAEIGDIEYDTTVYRMTVTIDKKTENIIIEGDLGYQKTYFPVRVVMDKSTDDGATWTNLYTKENLTEQNTIMLDETGSSFTNRQLENKRPVTVEKRWVGDGERVPVTVDLLQNGVVMEGKTVVLDASNNWTYTWEDLPLRDENGNPYVYTVREHTIPGYVVSYTTESGDKLVITNTSVKEIKFTLDLTKVSKEDNEKRLAGAEFQILKDNTPLTFTGTVGNYVYDESGAITTLVTDENGKLVVSGLPAGTYTLKETRAPEGYNEIEETITLDEKTPDAKLVLTLEDPESGYELPKTGGMGTLLYTISGVVLMGGALLMYYRKGKRKAWGE